MFATIHLVRHGEVHNPDGIVYADLAGFGLSDLGRAQADAAADLLVGQDVDVILCSPLQRAVETAEPIGAALGVPVMIDPDLTEWGLGKRWAGARWDELPTRFPGELEAYLASPTALPFSPESVEALALRMADVVARHGADHPGRTAVVVSHQDPIQALRLHLLGRDLATLHLDKPSHASVVTLERTTGRWQETRSWAPPQRSTPFPPVEEAEAP